VKKSKRDNRKTPGYVVDTLGPALFSTPDIIRRVGSNSDGKVADNTAVMAPSTSFATIISTSGISTSSTSSTTVSLNVGISGSNVMQNTSNLISKKTVFNTSEQSIQPEPQLTLNRSNNIISGSENEQKTEIKMPLTEELQPSLDTGKITSFVKLIL